MLKKHRKKLWTVLLLIILFWVVELPLRWVMTGMGYHIGSMAPNWQPMAEVDSLIVYDSYIADSLGIVRANATFWQKEGILINSDGFRGPEFAAKDSAELSVLLLGDSFTWGSQAEPLDSCFADLLALQGLRVYNTGIPGADPAQYYAIAQQYIPRLKPDHVVVCFYTGNDLMAEARPLKPYTPAYYITNIGWLPAEFEGHSFASAEESYTWYQHRYLPQSWWGKAAGYTAIGTLLMSLPHRFEERNLWEQRVNSAWSYHYLELIRQLCRQHGAQFTVAIIPELTIDLSADYTDFPYDYFTGTYPTTFEGVKEEILPLIMSKNHYVPPPNGHFNNAGHAEAASQIHSWIETLESKRE